VQLGSLNFEKGVFRALRIINLLARIRKNGVCRIETFCHLLRGLEQRSLCKRNLFFRPFHLLLLQRFLAKEEEEEKKRMTEKAALLGETAFWNSMSISEFIADAPLI